MSSPIADTIILVLTPSCQEMKPDRLQRYVTAIERAGGTCLIVPISQSLLRLSVHRIADFDGVLLVGGPDINPARYGGKPNRHTYGINDLRDEIEINLVKTILTYKIPCLAICRGLQAMAIAAGGSLYGHLPFPLSSRHRLTAIGGHYPTIHRIETQQGSKLQKITRSKTYEVLSFHHCCVRQVPTGWEVAARAEDNVIEALECIDHPYALGVQWHPEWSTRIQDRKLFKSFVDAASAYRQQNSLRNHNEYLY
jgi:putative glutamine amidotransferase